MQANLGNAFQAAEAMPDSFGNVGYRVYDRHATRGWVIGRLGWTRKTGQFQVVWARIGWYKLGRQELILGWDAGCMVRQAKLSRAGYTCYSSQVKSSLDILGQARIHNLLYAMQASLGRLVQAEQVRMCKLAQPMHFKLFKLC